MDENQEVYKLATVATVVEAGKRILLNAGDSLKVPYRPTCDDDMSTGDWVTEQFGAAFAKALQDQKLVGEAK